MAPVPFVAILPEDVMPPEPASNEPVPPADIVWFVALISPEDDIAGPDDAVAII